MPPLDYVGSLEEVAQEAIIIFRRGDGEQSAVEHMILKIRVEGDAENFAWIIPFPSVPEVNKESPNLFRDIFAYVQQRKIRMPRKKVEGKSAGVESSGGAAAVEVLSRKTIGDFEIAVVREQEENSLNDWLEAEGYQTLDDAEDVLDFYREKGFVFACVKVTSEALATEKEIESHPLRFTFETGGRDGIFFPMKLTGLQEDPFDVNLYVFHNAWLNDSLNKFGYQHRGFRLNFRDFDSPQCKKNAGKTYSLPSEDPYLKGYAQTLGSVTGLFQKLCPGETFYLTNIQANQLDPDNVRDWSDDLWMFPFYTDRSMIPFDVREGGPASTAWPDVQAIEFSAAVPRDSQAVAMRSFGLLALVGLVLFAGIALFLVQRTGCCKPKQIAKPKPEPTKAEEW